MLTVSTKCCRHSWMVRAVLPTPPSPSTTSLYSTILPAMMGAKSQRLRSDRAQTGNPRRRWPANPRARKRRCERREGGGVERGGYDVKLQPEAEAEAEAEARGAARRRAWDGRREARGQRSAAAEGERWCEQWAATGSCAKRSNWGIWSRRNGGFVWGLTGWWMFVAALGIS